MILISCLCFFFLVFYSYFFFFFFSSRRRHTRFSRDWSSDVCSSDLLIRAASHIKALEEAQATSRELSILKCHVLVREVVSFAVLEASFSETIKTVLSLLVAFSNCCICLSERTSFGFSNLPEATTT